MAWKRLEDEEIGMIPILIQSDSYPISWVVTVVDALQLAEVPIRLKVPPKLNCETAHYNVYLNSDRKLSDIIFEY
jgi:hypothetical protein